MPIGRFDPKPALTELCLSKLASKPELHPTWNQKVGVWGKSDPLDVEPCGMRMTRPTEVVPMMKHHPRLQYGKTRYSGKSSGPGFDNREGPSSPVFASFGVSFTKGNGLEGIVSE